MRVAARYQGSAGIVNDWMGTGGITLVSDDIYAFTHVGQRAKRLLKKSSERLTRFLKPATPELGVALPYLLIFTIS
jgi:hypothetical protein